MRAACALYSKPRHNVLLIMHAFYRLTFGRPCFLLQVKSCRWSIRVLHGFLDRATFMRHSTPCHNVLINTHVSWLFMMARSCWLTGGDFSGNLRPRLWVRAVGGISGYHMVTFARPPLCAYQHCLIITYGCRFRTDSDCFGNIRPCLCVAMVKAGYT